jgi:ATP-dependent DNA ligase
MQGGRRDYRSKHRASLFVFDLLVCQGRVIARIPLIKRRSILRSVLSFDSGRVRITDCIEAPASDMLHAVR